MMGKTHYRLAILYYLMLCSIPALASIPLLSGINSISLAGILVAFLGAIWPDADTHHSLINNYNPITGVPNKLVDRTVKMILALVRLALTFGLSGILLYKLNYLVENLSSIGVPKDHAIKAIYVSTAVLFLAGMLGEGFIRLIPGLSQIYLSSKKYLRIAADYVKRFVFLIAYVSCAIYMIVRNYNGSGSLAIYLGAVYIIIVAVFPHRTFLHSVEGLILSTYFAFKIFSEIGSPYLATIFMVSYATHLYLADAFTVQGVHIFFIGYLLKKSALHHKLIQKQWYKYLFTVLNFRLRIPLVATGTPSGARIEFAYVILILFCFGLLVHSFGLPSIILI